MKRQLDLGFDVLMPAGILTADEGEVLVVLSQHRGRDEAIPVAALAERTRLDGRRLQIIVKQLVEAHQVPIGTATRAPFGYYIIQSDEERREVRDSMMHRALSTKRRARAYDRGGWVAEMVGQVELGLGVVRK